MLSVYIVKCKFKTGVWQSGDTQIFVRQKSVTILFRISVIGFAISYSTYELYVYLAIREGL